MLGSAVLGATVLREPFAWAATPFQSVIVANTEDTPVPVAQTGTANVNVTNATLSVQEAVQPLKIRLSTSIDGLDYTVPVGKRLVIQYINGGQTDSRIFDLSTVGASWQLQGCSCA